MLLLGQLGPFSVDVTLLARRASNRHPVLISERREHVPMLQGRAGRSRSFLPPFSRRKSSVRPSASSPLSWSTRSRRRKTTSRCALACLSIASRWLLTRTLNGSGMLRHKRFHCLTVLRCLLVKLDRKTIELDRKTSTLVPLNIESILELRAQGCFGSQPRLQHDHLTLQLHHDLILLVLLVRLESQCAAKLSPRRWFELLPISIYSRYTIYWLSHNVLHRHSHLCFLLNVLVKIECLLSCSASFSV